jgi:anhydro-N-acetylmuramic acid kinase
MITTATEFTALSIYQQYLEFIKPKLKLDELFVSGGGTHNRYLMNALERYFNHIHLLTTDSSCISSDAKEAACFAVLANEAIACNAANVPGATGAKQATVLGTICLP